MADDDAMAEHGPSLEITEEQWGEARRLFDEMDHGQTLTPATYLDIIKLLDKWDELTPIECKALGNGNHTRVKAKYAVLRVADDDPGILITKEGNKRVVHTDILFDSIKKVHMESERCTHPRLATRLHFLFPALIPSLPHLRAACQGCWPLQGLPPCAWEKHQQV